MTSPVTTPDDPIQMPAASPDTRKWTILCVDDEPNILSALRRNLRAAGHQVMTAEGGHRALEVLQDQPIDLLISDMRMPGMDGAQLLEEANQRWPQTPRILLTGHADMSAAVAAINRGRIFRYLNKPWDETDLLATVDQAFGVLALQRERDRLEALTHQQNLALRDANTLLEQRVAERTAELSDAHGRLKRNYLNSIKMFSRLLELRTGRLAGHGRRVADCARQIARTMALPDEAVQQVFVAALLHDVGLVACPDSLLHSPVARFEPEQLARYRLHAETGEQMLISMDDMQTEAGLIRSHHERFDGRGTPDRLRGDEIPLGARILAVADAFDDLQIGHLTEAPVSTSEARTLIRRGRGAQFDPEVVDAFLQLTEPQPGRPLGVTEPTARPWREVVVSSRELEPEMVLARDLISSTGIPMLTNGHVLTSSLIQRIRAFETREGGRLSIGVRAPLPAEPTADEPDAPPPFDPRRRA